MRRSSYTPSFSQSNQEPLIVVEESGNGEEEEPPSNRSTPKHSLDIDSPVNPYLLSPWRDPRETRKHSLPTPQCTTGITASQVRRLSERGGEGSGPSPREAAFLATLSQAPGPAPGGRRHSVVTISKVPSTLFGRNRRESIAAVPTGAAGSRRDSRSDGPPSTDLRGSIHNLQLDIMDDIVQARKARMKLWNTSSEKVCEVTTVNETGASSPLRYTNRRYSDFVGNTATPNTLPTIQSFRRASENPNAIKSPAINLPPKSPQKDFFKTGFFASTNLLSSLASSAIEINKCEEPPPKGKSGTTSFLEVGDGVGKSQRSNSFDVSFLQNVKSKTTTPADESASMLTGWFAKRHQPIAKKKNIRSHSSVSFTRDVIEKLKEKDSKENKKLPKDGRDPLRKLIWDGKKAIVDSHILGSTLEGFLKRDTSSSQNKGAIPKDSSRNKKSTTTSSFKSPSNWFGKGDDDDSNDKCDSSLCSTLKDLFVK